MVGQLQRHGPFDVVAGQELQGDLAAKTAALQVLFGREKRMFLDQELLGPIRDDDEHAQGFELPGDIPEQVGRRTDRVEVVDEDDGGSPRHLGEERDQFPLEPLRVAAGICVTASSTGGGDGRSADVTWHTKGGDGFHRRAGALSPDAASCQGVQQRQVRFGVGEPFGAAPRAT